MSLLSDEQAQEIFKSEHCNISKDLAGILYRAIEAAVLEAQGKQEPVGKPHRWNDDGERCLDCGDKDWMVDKYCNAAPVVQQPALERYNKIMEGCSEKDPIERLRFFCSLSMSGQDWLDVERFFDDLTAPVVQPDMVMVPREPTEAMLKAIEKQWMCGSQTDMAKREYRAMLAAAEGKK